MKTSLLLLAGAALVGTVQIASAGDVSGKVTLKGTPKSEVSIDLGPACGKINPAKPTTRHYVVGSDGGLANVFVYIKDAKKALQLYLRRVVRTASRPTYHCSEFNVRQLHTSCCD